jgi:hypothetical protein
MGILTETPHLIKDRSARKMRMYTILTEFGMPMKLIRLIKTSLNETYSKVRSDDKASPSFKPVWIRKLLDKCLSI